MNSELKERIINIWADNINYDQPISEYDKETILYAILDDLVPDDFKYKLYLEKIKKEANRVNDMFTTWYRNSKMPNMTEYKKFYTELEKSFKYQLYQYIYIFFHPIVINNNFITEASEQEDSMDRRMIANDEFIFNVFINYLYCYTLDKEEFKEEGIDFKERYIPMGEYFLNRQQYFRPFEKNKSIFEPNYHEKCRYNDPKFLCYNSNRMYYNVL